MSAVDKGNNSEKKHSKSKGGVGVTATMEGTKVESSPESAKGDVVKADTRVGGVKHELKRQDSKNKSGGNNSKKESPEIKKELKDKGDAKKERTESKKDARSTTETPTTKKDAGISPKGSKTENNSSKKHDCSSKNSNNKKTVVGRGRGSDGEGNGNGRGNDNSRGNDMPKLTRQASQEEAVTPPPIRRKFSSGGRGKVLHRSQPISDDSGSPPATPDLNLDDKDKEKVNLNIKFVIRKSFRKYSILYSSSGVGVLRICIKGIDNYPSISICGTFCNNSPIGFLNLAANVRAIS